MMIVDEQKMTAVNVCSACVVFGPPIRGCEERKRGTIVTCHAHAFVVIRHSSFTCPIGPSVLKPPDRCGARERAGRGIGGVGESQLSNASFLVPLGKAHPRRKGLFQGGKREQFTLRGRLGKGREGRSLDPNAKGGRAARARAGSTQLQLGGACAREGGLLSHSAKDEERVVMAPKSEAPAQPAPAPILPRFVFSLQSMDLSSSLFRALWPLVSRWAGARPSIIIAHAHRIYALLCKNYPTPSFRLFFSNSFLARHFLPSPSPRILRSSRGNHSSHCHQSMPFVASWPTHRRTGAYSSSAFPTRQKPFHRCRCRSRGEAERGNLSLRTTRPCDSNGHQS